MKAGHAPFIPHLTHYVDIDHGAEFDYDTYLRWDIEWLKQCQGVLRLPGDSPGADREEGIARLYGLPVWYSLEEVPHA